MRILFVGDSHGNTRFFNSVFDVAVSSEVDLIISVGDFGFWPIDRHGLSMAFFNQMANKSISTGIPLWVVDGNHDYPGTTAVSDGGYRYFRTNNLTLTPSLQVPYRGTTVELSGKRFGFCGGGISVDYLGRMPGKSWWSEEALTSEDVSSVEEAGPVDIWVTHDSVEPPPVHYNGHVMFKADTRFGDPVDSWIIQQRDLMRQAFEAAKPALHIHGHWHCRYSAPTPYGQVIGLGYEHDDALYMLEI